MIFYHKGSWHLCSEKVRYIQHGEELIQYVRGEGHQSWLDFEKKWDHTEIIEFIQVEPTQEQLLRYEEAIKLGIGDGYSGELGEYVESGAFPEGFNHVLRPIQIAKEVESLGLQSALSTTETIQVLTTLNEQARIEQAESNAELIDLMIMLQGGI